MNLSLWRVASAWRRACRSPRLASVISFSTSGLTALALAWLVWIRSCSISCFERFESSADRCALSRLSLLRFFLCRTGSSVPSFAPLVCLKIEAAGVQGLDYFLDRLRAEVRDRVQFRARLAHEVADGLHAGTLEAVVGADAEFKLLDQDLVEAVAGGTAVLAGGGEPVAGDGRHRLTRGEFFDPVGVGEDRQALDQDLGGFAQRRPWLDRAIGPEVERQFVEVGPLPDAGGGDRVGGAPDRREDRVDRDHPDRLLV